MMGTFNILAEAFRYPAPGLLKILEANQAHIAERQIQTSYTSFLRQTKTLSLTEWEELYTRTLDLSPAVAPYIGFQMWGEGYQRGSFMALMNHAMQMEAIETEGELPDHLIPVLRYLEVAAHPPAELLEALKPAVKRMRAVLHKADPDNPYNHLLQAVLQGIDRLPLAKDRQAELNTPMTQESNRI
jgi:nitrate reductase delta subunit